MTMEQYDDLREGRFLSESQTSLIKFRRTVVDNKYQEQMVGLFITLVDILKRSSQSVVKDSKIMTKSGCVSKLVYCQGAEVP